MNQELIQLLVDEIRPLLVDRFCGKIFQLSSFSFAIDFGLREGRYLFISAEPASPQLYLIKRRIKDLEKQSTPQAQFGQSMRARLGGASVLSVIKDPDDRVVRICMARQNDVGDDEHRTLLIQLTGRSANLFILDESDKIMSSLREGKTSGQAIGEKYKPPHSEREVKVTRKRVPLDQFESVSAALDSFFAAEEHEKNFQSNARNLLGRLRKAIRQKSNLKDNLERDLTAHGDPQEHKRLGDLLLANISTVKRTGSKILIQDFYSEDTPTIELELEEGTSLQEAASNYFSRYAKAKRAREQINERLEKLSTEIDDLLEEETTLKEIIERHDEAALARLIKPDAEKVSGRTKRQRPVKIPGVRAYKSSDGYEILVGRGARDNDYLTFRVARPNDLWLHTADYPGSHVVIRRENRKEIPHRTIVEAAQLAARFSQASKDSKVVVHYTSRKFLSKPRGAAPGLVRMSDFKSMIVEPKESVERIREI